MKKVSLITLGVLASVLLTFADTEKKIETSNLNTEQRDQTELEIITDNFNDTVYESIYNDVESFYIKSTMEENKKDSLDTNLYNRIYEDFNNK